MLKVSNLQVRLEEEDKAILKGVDLEVRAGEVHAVMGPNGSGKSTLSYVLAGRDGYEVTGGTASLDGEDLAWAVGSWAVARAADTGVVQVTVGDQRWNRSMDEDALGFTTLGEGEGTGSPTAVEIRVG